MRSLPADEVDAVVSYVFAQKFFEHVRAASQRITSVEILAGVTVP